MKIFEAQITTQKKPSFVKVPFLKNTLKKTQKKSICEKIVCYFLLQFLLIFFRNGTLQRAEVLKKTPKKQLIKRRRKTHGPEEPFE